LCADIDVIGFDLEAWWFDHIRPRKQGWAAVRAKAMSKTVAVVTLGIYRATVARSRGMFNRDAARPVVLLSLSRSSWRAKSGENRD